MKKQIGNITLYDVDESVEQLEVTKSTLLGYIKTGELIAQKVGAKYWVTENMLQQFLETPYHKNRDINLFD